MYELPLEYWRASILYANGRGLGNLIKIDKPTLDEIGLFARILKDVDLARPMAEKIIFREKIWNSSSL